MKAALSAELYDLALKQSQPYRVAGENQLEVLEKLVLRLKDNPNHNVLQVRNLRLFQLWEPVL